MPGLGVSSGGPGLGGSPPGGLLWGVSSWGVPGGDPPGMATALGGTHPTGMHSCVNKCFLPKEKF